MAGIDCKDARRRLPDRVDGPMEMELLDHIGCCASCADELRVLRSLLAATKELSGRDVPDPGEAYWETFVPSVRARISRHAGSPRRHALHLSRVAAAGILMVGAATGAWLVSRTAQRQDPVAPGWAAAATVDDAGRRLDEALGSAPQASIELAADVIDIDPLPEIGASEILQVMEQTDRPASLSGPWVDFEDDELLRLLDSLDLSQARALRAELAAERG